MKKTITVTASEFAQMGWTILEQYKNIQNFELTICNDSEARKITCAYVNENNDTVQLPEYSFDYFQTLQDLDDMDLLPAFIRRQESLIIYNDQQNQKSSKVFRGNVADIIGIHHIEIMLYSSFEELNADLSGCSFGSFYDEPEFKIAH